MTNCVNCGAPLHGDICPYCGTEYHDGKITADFSSMEYTGNLKLGNKEIPVYIAEMTAEAIGGMNEGWDIDGMLVRSAPIIKRTWTLIERG